MGCRKAEWEANYTLLDGKGIILHHYAASLVTSEASISAMMLAGKIVTMAHKNDAYKAKDDISCATIYFREPRKLLICTGPPYEKEKDRELASRVNGYKGKVILSWRNNC